MKWGREDIKFSDDYNFNGERITPPNLWQRIVNFFRRLFGGK